MDKRKVLAAYRGGMLTLHECAQILGIESMRVMGIMTDVKKETIVRRLNKQPMNS